MKADELSTTSVARYLWAEKRIVPFRERPELDELLSWCNSKTNVKVRLVAGNGGTGKTRLALQLCQRLEANGWQPLWVQRDDETRAVNLIEKLKKRSVLVVDYAETRNGLGEMLLDVTGDPDGPDRRVVLLARGTGEWWERLTNSDKRLDDKLAAPPIWLGPMFVAGKQDELFQEAVTAFAKALGVERPNVTLTLTDPEPVVLVLHAAALLAVLRHARQDDGDPPRSGDDVIGELLGHEKRYWQGSAEARGLDLNLVLLNQAVVAGCLVGADSKKSAIALLARIPDLADSTGERRGKIASLLHGLYPERLPDGSGIREWIGPLQPDLVGERLVVEVLSEGQEGQDLTRDLFQGLDNDRATRALTVLARAARTQTQSLELIRIVLAADLEHLVIPALSVAIETNPVLSRLLAKTLSDYPISASALEQITEITLYPSATLAPAAVVVARRLADEAPTDAMRAASLVNLSNRLGDLKEPEQALAAIEQAATIYRRLADDRPNEYLFNLGVALSNESGRLGALDRWAEALGPVEQALTIYSQLAEKHPDDYLPAMATGVNSLSNCLSHLDRLEDALETAGQAASIYRDLAEDNPAFVPHFATAMYNLSNRLASLERWEAALTVIGYAVDNRRKLAEDRPDIYLEELAASLLKQANCLTHLDRSAEALAPVEDAVDIFRHLVELYGDAYRPGLSATLDDFANLLDFLDRNADAKAAREEAAAVLGVQADPSDPTE